ncbi:HupE/UreJ family protein [Paenibacillus glycanilyticus]|uniref:HupE/UreJ family protein n=1 Tax=Paenibacillus glycanilyticus TaxID=126569 RepID=UPI00203C5E79|nr:HupE/UreJ family protein [Paenibacillus glycanilyticus]MCM3630538.1 HupE/UreJ family protein [Paenibacillus glycanilyticus]
MRVKWSLSLIAMFLLIFALMPVSQVSAHTDNSEGFSKISAASRQLNYELMLDYFEFGRVVMLDARPDQSEAELLALLDQNKQAVLDYVNAHLKIYINGEAVDGMLAETKITSKLGRYYADLSLNYPNPSNAKGVEVDYTIFFDDNDSMHRNIAAYSWEGREGQFVFNSGERHMGLGNPSYIGQAWRFIQLGFHHIMIGLDHILFVIALVLTSKSFRSIFRIATVFTLAHSVTLGLSAFHVLSVPSEIVEPLIALSIAYVALEASFLSDSKARPFVVFGFGLVHGIGFAGALEMTGAINASSMLSLAAFNIGVEGGQLLIISLLFPLLLYIRRYSWSRPVQIAAVAFVFVSGIYWYMERMMM